MTELTVKAIERAKAKKEEYRLKADKGLYLVVSTTGRKTWAVRYSINGKQNYGVLPLPYGTTDGRMSLADARAENQRIQSLARKGIDYKIQEKIELRTITEKQTEELERDKTFLELYETWLNDGVNRKDDNAEIKRSFKKDVLPSLSNMRVSDISDSDISRLLRKIVKERDANRIAVCVHEDLIQLFNWAEKRKPWRKMLIEGNPAELVDIRNIISPNYEDAHGFRDRVLFEEEVRELRDIFERTTRLVEEAPKGEKRKLEQPLARKYQLAVWISLSTLCRIGELSLASWKHVDFEKGEWFIPEENVKKSRGKRQALLVLLSPFALRQFKELYEITGTSDWLFPSKNGVNHVTEKVITRRITNRQLMFKDLDEEKDYAKKCNNQLVLANGVNGKWIMHDLRRTGATWMQKLKIEPDVIDRCQNHVIHSGNKRVRKHYQLYDFAEEKREAWYKLGNYIENILSDNSNLLFLKDNKVA